MQKNLDNTQQELAYRLLGNAHEDVLTAFEATQKMVYLDGMAQRPKGGPPIKPVANDFQNINRARTRFQDLALDPFQGLDARALDALALNVQKRHIIGHNLRVVDAKFAQHAQNALVGETVKLVGDDIRIFAGLCQAVIDDLDAWLAGGKPAPARTAMPTPTPLPEPSMDRSLDDIDASALAKRVGIWIAKSSNDGRPGLDVQSQSVVESVYLILQSGRSYGTGTTRLRHDHARRPSCNTAIESFGQRAS